MTIALEAVVPAWMADVGLDKESFRQQNFGTDGSAMIAGLAQDFGQNLHAALTNRSAAQAGGAAGASLAQLVREVRLGGLNRATMPPAPERASRSVDAALSSRWQETTEAALRDPKQIPLGRPTHIA